MNSQKFEYETHNIKFGDGFLNDAACCNIIQYLSCNIMSTSITNPVNDGTIHYYSIHNDGSSCAKTMDEKELYIINTVHNG